MSFKKLQIISPQNIGSPELDHIYLGRDDVGLWEKYSNGEWVYIVTGGTTGAGTSGTSGKDGSSGADGTFLGSSGTSGLGSSGTSGISGTSGTSGVTGTSGTSGITGTSGSSGIGSSGYSGTSGSSGENGTSGSSGVDGIFFGSSGTSGISGYGGSARKWIFSTSSYPVNSGYFYASGISYNLQDVITIRINQEDADGQLIDEWINSWVNGTLKIEEFGNPSNFGIYSILSGITTNTKPHISYFQISGVTTVIANGMFVENYYYLISYVQNGIGYGGTCGTSGASGVNGSSGTSGANGSSGINGLSINDGMEYTYFYNNFKKNGIISAYILTSVIKDNAKLLIGGMLAVGEQSYGLIEFDLNGLICESNKFNFDSNIETIKIQRNNKILIGGCFSEFEGNTRNRLIRLNSDYSEDVDFYTDLGSGFNSDIYAVYIQNDSKILVGGMFSTFNGNTRNGLVRLNSDGTEDTDFYNNLGDAANSYIYSIITNNDKILVGGTFTYFNGHSRKYLIRLNSDGTEDTDFYNNLGSSFNDEVWIVSNDNDKILVGGMFSTFNGNTRNGLVRLNSDGTEDTDFYNNLGTGFGISLAGTFIIRELLKQPDNKILVGGIFDLLNENVRNNLVRLNQDGTEDTDFYNDLGESFNGSITNITSWNGLIYVSGEYTEFNNNTRTGTTCLYNYSQLPFYIKNEEFIDDINFEIRDFSTGKTYTLNLSSSFSYMISGLSYLIDDGSPVFTILHNSTGITGLINLTGTTFIQRSESTDNNIVLIGDRITLIINDQSSSTVLDGSLQINRFN